MINERTMERQLWYRIMMTLIFGLQLSGVFLGAATHEWALAILATIFTVVFAIFFGRSWWPVKEVIEVKVKFPYAVHPPADKRSNDYKMGYEDGKNDAADEGWEA